MNKAILFILGLIILVFVIGFIAYQERKAPSPQKAMLDSARGKASAGKTEPVKVSYWWPQYRGERGLLGRAQAVFVEKPVRKWSFQSNGAIHSGVVVGFGMVYFGNQSGRLYGLSSEDGKKGWEIDLGESSLSTPLLMDNSEPRLYVGSHDGVFMAVNALTGKEIWRYEVGAKINGAASFFYDKGKPRIVFGSYDGKLYCLNENGKLIWSIEAEDYINGSPAIGKSGLVFAGCDGFLRQVDLLSGKEVEKIALGSYIPSSPVMEGDAVWVNLFQGGVHAIDLSSKKILWSFSAKNMQSPMTPPAVNEKYVTSIDQNGRIFILDKVTGNLHLELSVPAKVASDHLQDANKLILADKAGYIHAFDLDSGIKIWQLQHGAPITAPLAAPSNRLYVGDHDGILTVYESKQGVQQ